MKYTTSYIITEEIQQESIKQYFFKHLLGKKVYLFFFFVGAAVLTFVVPTTRNRPLPIVCTVAASIYLGIWIKAYFTLIKQAKVQFDLLESKEIKIEFNEDEITYTSSTGLKKYNWKNIDSYRESKDFIVLFKAELPLMTVMKAHLNEESLNYIKKEALTTRSTE